MGKRKGSRRVTHATGDLKIGKLKPIGASAMGKHKLGGNSAFGQGRILGRFPPTCERIIKGIKRSNKNRSNKANPFAIAQSNKKCKTALRKSSRQKQIAMLLMTCSKQFVLTLRTVILDKIKKNPQTITSPFDTLNEKNSIHRHTIRGRLSELVKAESIKKEGSTFSFIQ